MRIISILFAMLFALTAGCASVKHYEGPERPKSEIAVIFKGYSFSSRGRDVELFSLGNLKSSGGTEYKSMGKRSEVLPGEVRFGASVEYLASTFGRRIINIIIKFNAEAGKRYVVHGWSGENPGVWVLDLDTGFVVAKEGAIPEEIISESKKYLKHF